MNLNLGEPVSTAELLVDPCEILYNFNQVLHFGVHFHSTSIFHLQSLADLGHLRAVEVEERLNKVSVDKTLKSIGESAAGSRGGEKSRNLFLFIPFACVGHFVQLTSMGSIF